MKRRTGTTTRIIDDAIQELFKEGKVFISDHDSLKENLSFDLAERAFRILKKRLETEHSHIKFTYSKGVNMNIAFVKVELDH